MKARRAPWASLLLAVGCGSSAPPPVPPPASAAPAPSVAVTPEPVPSAAPPPEVAPTPPAPKTFAEMNNAFAARLFGALGKGRGNLFFSPTSVSTALGMTYGGAKGETALEMERALSFSLNGEALHAELARASKLLSSSAATGGPDLSIANRLWPAKSLPLVQSFVASSQRYYGAAPEPLDFASPEAARARINGWVKDQTKQMIPELLKRDMIDRSTQLVLTNAVYFKGKWEKQFDKKQTKVEPFTPEQGAPIPTPLMQQKLRAGYDETPDAQVLELAYKTAGKGPRIVMDVILPKNTAGLAALESKLIAGGIAPRLGSLRESEVQVTLPRFKVSWNDSLNEPLKSLGMPLAFTGQADFSGLSAEKLHIDRVQHEAVVDVNEEGTEAAAATAVVMTKSAALLPLTFRADRPFLFLLRDADSGTILFFGRFAKP